MQPVELTVTSCWNLEIPQLPFCPDASQAGNQLHCEDPILSDFPKLEKGENTATDGVGGHEAVIEAHAPKPSMTGAAVKEQVDGSRRRYRRILAALLSAVVGKGATVLVNLIAVPLLVRYMGPEEYGLWVTISTMAGMLIILDVGTANSLTNLISEAYAHDRRDAASSYFASAFWSMLAIISAAGIIARLVWPLISWSALFHIQDARLAAPLSMAVAAAIAVFLCGLPAALGARVLAGYQELHTVNFLTAICSLLSLVCFVILVALKATLPWFVVCSIGSPVAANMLSVVWVLVRKPWMSLNPLKVRRDVIGRIYSSGSQFFLIQLGGLVVFSSDNLVISHYLSPADVTPYSIIWRIVGYVNLLQMLTNPALWPAYAEAWQRGDVAWVRKTYNGVRWTTATSLICGIAILVPFGRSLIRLWAGPAAVPSTSLLRLMCVWMILFAWTNQQSILMGAVSRMRLQSITSLTAAILNLVLTILWVRPFGTVGVLLATIVTYVVFILFTQCWVVRSILRGQGAPAPAAQAMAIAGECVR